jgi:signal transduction histidine kinase
MKPNSPERINEVLDMIASMAALNFSKRLEVNLDPDDPLEAIAYGLNMVGEELEANVVEKQRLAEVNNYLAQFAYTTSHDLKSPLNSVLGLTELLKLELEKEGVRSARIEELTDLMSHSIFKMKSLIDGILTYSRLTGPSSSALEEIDVAAELREQLKSKEWAGADIRILTELPIVWYNRAAFSQILINLLGNAIKFNNKEKCIVELDCIRKEKEFVFSISDNGPGISPAVKDKIFDLFVHIPTSNAQEGTGIGLATVKKLVESYGGRIWLGDYTGTGSVFYFSIPIGPTERPRHKDL